MAIELNAAGDFATIVDGAEAITLKRKGSATTMAVAAARRLSSRTSEAEPSGGHVAQADVEWQLPWDGATDPPRLGDALIDAVQRRDYPLIMATTLAWTAIISITYLITDLLYALVDPRVTYVKAR